MSNDLTTLSLPVADLQAAPVSSSLHGTIVSGAIIVAIAFGGFGGWAAVAPLDSAVVAAGQLTVETRRKTIQHLEGGIVKEILVKEGNAVVAGQTLLRLDGTKARSTLDAVQGQYDAALAELARLTAERDGLATIAFPPELTGHAGPAEQAAMAAQRMQFAERRKTLAAQVSVLRQHGAELEAEGGGDISQQGALDKQIALSRKELNGLRELAAKGYYPKNHLLAMEREIARMEGERAVHGAAEARIGKGIAETRLQEMEMRQHFREQVAKELDIAQNHVTELRDQLAAVKDTVSRLDVTAPVAGIVQNIRVTTDGGVIQPGMDLMDVVPSDDRLIIEAKVQPSDIESVQADQPAEVRFSALKGRNSPVLKARVLTVSADSIVDPGRGFPYYAVRVEVPKDQLVRLQGRRIQAGMPVQVMLKGGERTALDYLLQPLLDSFATSFKES